MMAYSLTIRERFGLQQLVHRRRIMVKHSGGKVGKAARQLVNKSTSKSTKSNAVKILKKHQDKKH